ncbi:MAG: glycosyltransferase family 4 protein, partial [Anaerolineae bacterium]|nr:glycosyltransferase family 4 protein [Anaerolineae bacterium]
MRIGIDARPLQLEAYRNRGIGIHLRGWIQAAQNLGAEHAFVLLFDPALANPSLTLSSPSWQLQPLSLPFSPPHTSSLELHLDSEAEFVFDSALEAFLLENKFDLFHATYTFMWEAFVPRRLYNIRWVATFYDLIPLIFKNDYLDPLGECGRRSFAQRLGAGVYAQRIQTISQASKADLVRHHLAADKIDVIYGGVESSFAPLDSSQTQALLTALNIREPYIFSVSGFHHTKNLRRLCEAYALLPADLRAAYRLVVRCPLGPANLVTVQGWLQELGIAERVSLLAPVTQAQLVGLYNGAALVVHPTLYEGLGLPVVEALQCGAPVVTSSTSSLPEVGGEAAEYVDPSDASSIAQGMARVLTDAALRAQRREVGLRHALRFTWQKTAQAV